MKKLSTILLGLALSAPAFAQNAIGNTTLSGSIQAYTTNVCVASATGIVVPSLAANSGQLGSFLVVDSEVMRVQAQGTTSTCFNVNRGYFANEFQGGAVFHGNGAKVWVLGQNISTGDTSRPVSTSAFFTQRTYQPMYVAATPGFFGVTPNTTVDTLGTFFVSALEIDVNMIAQGACWYNNSIVTTDKHIAYLWDATGTLVANTTLAGTADSGNASKYQCVNFVSPVGLIGPAQYFVGIQANGTTDNFNTYAAGATHSSFATTSFAGTFGTAINIATIPTTFTANVGPFMTLF